MEKSFDLNIEEILDNWEIYHAVREIIANALDEMVLSRTEMISIEKTNDGLWHIRDFGRGLEYSHLTQNENKEKRDNPSVIGKFGVGLKDAIAVLYKNGVSIKILSKYSDITFEMRPKVNFPDKKTIHALISDPTNKGMRGTEFILGVSDEEIEKAKSLFIVFSGREPLDKTTWGNIYPKKDNSSGSVYVHGVKIAEEPNFLFDYDIVKTNPALEKNLNRERSAVGKTAYSGIIDKILLQSKEKTVIEELINQLKEIPKGTNCDEINHVEIQIHAVKKYNASERVVFISQTNEYNLTNNDKEKIAQSGRKVVSVPEKAFERIEHDKDYDGNEIATFSTVLREYNEKFKYEYVDPALLTDDEKLVFALKEKVLSIYENKKYLDRIFVSNNINETTSGDTLGVYELSQDRIIIKRTVLQDSSLFCEVLFHELVHATTGYKDNTRDFENGLGKVIKLLSSYIINDEE